MNRAIAWFADNRVAANLLMVFILVSGIFSLGKVKVEVFPEINADMITVSVAYLGAAPEETEEAVCVRVEEAIADLDGIKKITATASEGMGIVSTEIKMGYDVRKLLDDIKSRVDAISTFPKETEKPVVQEVLIRRQVVNVAVSGQTDLKSLKSVGERIRDEIADLEDVSQVELVAAKPYEISIEVSEETLRRYNLTFDEIARAVRMSSLDLPGGSIRTDGGELTIRTKGQAYIGNEFSELVLRSLPDGTRLKLGDVATVVDGFAETDQSSRFNNEPTVLLQVFRVGEENAITVANSVKEYIKKAQKRLPNGIHLTAFQDTSLILKDRMSLLMRNGRMGFILVFLALALFLRLRLSAWVTLGMIISFFGAFWLMPSFDVSLNMISLFAFILVLGIVVDDAIVVGENIYSKMEEGHTSFKAAVLGTQEVAVPVIFAVLTTVAAFSPLLFVDGFMGKIMRNIPIIVISTLLFSLVESLFILPAHLSHLKIGPKKKKKPGLSQKWNKIQDRLTAKLDDFINFKYKNLLSLAIAKRYLVFSIAIGLLVISIGFVAGGWINFTFMPKVEADNVMASLTMPQGTAVDVTTAAISRIEQSAIRLQAELTGEEIPPITHILTSIGNQPFKEAQAHGTPAGGSSGPKISKANIGEVTLQLTSAEIREISSPEIARRWRELTGIIPDAEEVTFSSSLFSAGDAINFQLSGTDYDQLQIAAEDLKGYIAQYPGVFDISDSFREGKKEIKLKIKPEAETLGLTLSNLARQVRQAFYGEEAQRIQRGRDDIRVMVRYPESERRSIGDLENMRIRIPGGVEVPFSLTAEAEEGIGFSSIKRTDRKRTINVTADVDVSKGNSNEIVADIVLNVMPDFLERNQGITYGLEGEQNEQQETMQGLARGFMTALLFIYILLAIPFKSYIQPIVVMLAIPFGLIGAIMGHVIMMRDLTMISVFGIVALSGVVVNDSLVFVDFINRKRKGGLPLKDAILEAGTSRFRPIMLTSLTTFAGLTPLLIEKSMQAQFLIPMAVSLGFGVLFATLISLILVPSTYHMVEDMKVFVRTKVLGKVNENSVEENAAA